jgi:hypothetical protein
MQRRQSSSTGSATITIAHETKATIKTAVYLVLAISHIVFALGKLPGMK